MQLDPRDDDLNELDMAARRKMARAARRSAKRRAVTRKRKEKRKKNTEELMKKARRMAIKLIRKKFLKDKKYEDLPFAQRDMIDQKVKKVPSSRLDNLAKKLLPKAKAAEKERIERLRDKED